MIRTFELSATPLPPADPNARLPVGPTDLRDPGGREFVAQWLGHVEAGRIGGHLCPPTAARHEESLLPTAALHEASVPPTAALHEAGRPPIVEAARAIVLANERLLFGRQRTVID